VEKEGQEMEKVVGQQTQQLELISKANKQL